jgi:hypothetical protein
MRTDVADRPPRAEDVVALGRIHLEDGDRFEPLAETGAWCWQLGCMLQWMPGAADRLVFYNVRLGDSYGAVIHDLATGEKRELPRAAFCLAPDGKTALCVNFARLNVTRPGYGYAGIPDPFAEEPAPENDGVWRMDLESGRCELIVPLSRLAAAEPAEDMAGMAQWVNHVQVNPGGTRFAMLHRYRRPSGTGHVTRLFTADMDGSDLYCLNPNRMTSHYDWRDDTGILAWARTPDSPEDEPVQQYLLFADRSDRYDIVGEGVLLTDGHCSWSPDRRWIMTDTYPGGEAGDCRALLLYDPAANRRVEIGRFLSPPDYRGEIRCDLHPRWSRGGRQVCFDSTHEQGRKMYVAEVSAVVAG